MISFPVIISAAGIASLLVGCASRPEIGDTIEVLAPATAYRDLDSFDRAHYYRTQHAARTEQVSRMGGDAMIASMTSSGEILTLPTGTTGEIVGFPRPTSYETVNGNTNDGSHFIADIRLDDPKREVVLMFDKNVRVIKSEHPAAAAK